MSSGDNTRYLVGVGFALIVFGACFYGIVLYEYNLDDLKTGALISLMTLAANFVFAEAVARGAARRTQQSYEAGLQGGSTTTTTVDPPTTTTVVSPPEPTEDISG